MNSLKDSRIYALPNQHGARGFSLPCSGYILCAVVGDVSLAVVDVPK